MSPIPSAVAQGRSPGIPFRTGCGLLLAAAVLVAGGPASGWERQGDSARKNLKGKELFRSGLKLEAARVWEEAFLDSCGGEELGIANNLGIVHYQLAQPQPAYYFFQYALTLDALGAFHLKNRSKVEAAAAELEKSLSKDYTRIEIQTTPIPNTRICFASQALGGCYKTPFVWYATDGLHLLKLSRERGEETAVELNVVRGKPQVVTVELPGIAQEAPTFARTFAGPGHSCGLAEGGRLSCWGDNRFAQLGGGTCEWVRKDPLPVLDLPAGVTDVSIGGHATCAVTGDGLAWCWGDNTSGQVGNGSGGGEEDVVGLPAPVCGIPSEAVGIAAGGSHACVLLGDGSVRCWGANHRGQLGVNLPPTTLAMTAVPMPVPGLTAPAIRIAAGKAHTCALLKTGVLVCWGANEGGQLGDGTTTSSLLPVAAVALGTNLTDVTCAGQSTCATTADGKRSCVGGEQD